MALRPALLPQPVHDCDGDPADSENTGEDTQTGRIGERAARQSQEPGLGSGCPAPPTPRSYPRAVPVSNGESISTASARDRARPVPHLFPAFFVSTNCPQNMTGYPHSVAVFHRLLHRSSTGYPALPAGTLSCSLSRRVVSSRAFSNRYPYPRVSRRLAGDIRPALSGGSPRRIIAGRALRRATMRMISRGRRHWRRRVRPGEGR